MFAVCTAHLRRRIMIRMKKEPERIKNARKALEWLARSILRIMQTKNLIQ